MRMRERPKIDIFVRSTTRFIGAWSRILGDGRSCIRHAAMRRQASSRSHRPSRHRRAARRARLRAFPKSRNQNPSKNLARLTPSARAILSRDRTPISLRPARLRDKCSRLSSAWSASMVCVHSLCPSAGRESVSRPARKCPLPCVQHGCMLWLTRKLRLTSQRGHLSAQEKKKES